MEYLHLYVKNRILYFGLNRILGDVCKWAYPC
jgi:hypothetical protein